MEIQPAILWDSFKEGFITQIRLAGEVALTEAWQSSSGRTGFYCDKLLPDVAKQMGLELRTELFRVDASLCKLHQTTKQHVPLIFIESENYAHTASHEMHKLCCLSSPVRVLITCTEWGENIWEHQGTKDTLLKEWGAIIKSYADIWPQNGVLGLIVAEWSDKLSLYISAWNSNGEIHKVEEQIFPFDH